uniref:Uncharacterized protein n=1 Tax=Chrysemys picta bellii TaxID=8478 RepID=A0A8C3HHY1_CHRPI
MPNRIQVLSVKNPLLHILCKCYCFCLLLLETQLVQSVQLEKLAFFFFSFLEHLAQNKLTNLTVLPTKVLKQKSNLKFLAGC